MPTKPLVYRRLAQGALVVAGLGFILLWRMDRAPLLWWDEGWTLTVARNWVERGFYGRLLNGELASPGLSASLSVVASVALSFRLFGVGIWQGRLPGLLFTCAALWLIYYLTRQLYNRPTALAALAVGLVMAPDPGLHPIYVGRQVLAEMPMLLFLLGGFAAFLLSTRRSVWWLLLADFFWGLSLATKAQVLPFWTVALMAGLLFVLLKRQRKLVALFALGLAGSYGWFQVFSGLQLWVIGASLPPTAPLQGLYDITALAPDSLLRVNILLSIGFIGLPAAAGLFHQAWAWLRQRLPSSAGAELPAIRLALLVLAGSWFVWYVVFSIGWERYLFPPVFLSSFFVAAMLQELSGDFNVPWVVANAGGMLRRGRVTRQGLGALFVVFLVGIMLPLSLGTWRVLLQPDSSRDAATEVAAFLNTSTQPNALIETYESELFFLLHRAYHYPPDQLHIELNRRLFLEQPVNIDYDPLVANPDYLVVGSFGSQWRLYDPVLAGGDFRLVRTFDTYYVYERVR